MEVVTMTDKELRKEKLDYLFEKISKVKSNTDLKEILKKVDELNVYLDKNDSPLENLLDTITQNLSTSIQTKIKRKLHDIFDKYDKKSKAGALIYTDSDRQKIQELIRQINEICDKNFGDRYMKKSSAKKKLFLLKILAVILCPITVFATTTFFVFIGCAELWKDIPTCGITSFIQWFTLISYRIIVYLLPAIILSFFRFDKRYKWMTRFIIFLNWTLFIYLFCNVVIKFFELDSILQITIFENLDNVVMLLGYVLTAVNKRKIEFDSNGAIIGDLKQ